MQLRALFPLALLTLFSLTQHDSPLPEPSASPVPPASAPSPAKPLVQAPSNSEPVGVGPGDSPLQTALRHGQPVSIATGEQEAARFLFRPRRSVAEPFAITLGAGGRALENAPLIYEGLSLTPGQEDLSASIAIVGQAVGAVLRHANGAVTYIRSHPRTGRLEAQTESFGHLDTVCSADPQAGLYRLESDVPVSDGEAFWVNAEAVRIAPETAALTGLDPATDRLDKYINPIPRATHYDASLKDALMLLVLDKEATGANTTANLTSKASLFLATVSNVAAAYENQLGIRLLVQEMILIPDSDEFEDIPSDGIEDFRDWLAVNRLNGTYRWSMASRFGAGLEGQTLGVAFVSAIGNSSAVSVCRATARWDVLAHEMGHNLGSEHSEGGLMNATSSGGSSRSFFTDVSSGETSAKDIYDYSEAARSRLYGSVKLRHPEQIPFANRDSESTPMNTPVTLSPLSNDDNRVRNGVANTLALEEVGPVTPAGAGTVAVLGNDLRFTPSPAFEGSAWFSYSLRGNMGNGGAGWLHKGDVAVRVGSEASSLTLTLAPGASYSFVPSSGTSGLSQPRFATVDRSRDDSRLLIVRVNADARGTDSFRAGGRTYTLAYTDAPPRVTRDVYVYDVREGRLVFNPLLNDEGAGENWINPIKPTIGVGTAGHDADGDALFPTTFRLASITNRTPEKGSLSTRTLPFIIDGKRNNRLDSTVTFVAKSGASGTALLDYTVEDAVGQLTTGEIEILLPFRIDALVATGDLARYRVATDATDEASWMLPEFDDSAWASGSTGLGYDTGSDYLPEIATTIETLRNVSTSLYVRIPFAATEVAQFTNMALRMKVDDGFVAYLNGHEIARSSLVPPGMSPLPWNVQTTATTSDSEALTFASFDLTPFSQLLREGSNLLAVHGINGGLGSSDFLLVPELEASVTSSGIQLVSPSAPEITLPTDTWLSLETRSTGAVAGGAVVWEVISGLSDSVQIDGTGATGANVRFTAPGNFVLQGAASVDSATATTELAVRVLPSNQVLPANSAAAIALEDEIQSTQLATPIEAFITPVEATGIEWTQLSGPTLAVISDPSRARTTIATTTEGNYRFRISVRHQGATTYDDVGLTVSFNPAAPPPMAALALPAKAVTPTSATLQGSTVLLPNAQAEASFVWGRADAGPNAAGWRYRLDLGPVSAGTVSARAMDLLFETRYFYRLRLRASDGRTVVWSDPGSFTTKAAPLLATRLIDSSSSARVRVPTSNADATAWRAIDFDDASWTGGRAAVGYDLDVEFLPWIETNVQEAMYGQGTAVFIRVPFELDETRSVESLALRIRYDDAFIAFLNGKEIARSATAPQSGEVNWETTASILRDDDEALVLENYELSQHLGLLRPGRNVLAIQGLNNIALNRDLLIAPELEIESRQSDFGNWIARFPLSTGVAGLHADPDQDGLSNLTEYALGGNPAAADYRPDFLPELTTVSGRDLAIQYRRRAEAAERGLHVALERSADLLSWMRLETISESVVADGTVDRVSIPLRSEEESPSLYWRLQISLE